MKKILTVLILLVSISINAQSKGEKSAKNISDQITKTLALSEADSEKVYELAMIMDAKINEYKTAHPNMDKKVMKKNIKPYKEEFETELAKIVGEEGMKKLNKAKKQKSKKKKTS